jgi:spermidine/putrescine transport system ATP-binding protein
MTPDEPTDMTGDLRDLRLVNVTKSFADFVAVDDLTLTVPGGSFFALLGPSGCGKTTTLRMVAGLEEPSAGSLYIGDEDITRLKPFKRPVNTVFQSYALFPHLTIFDNVAFGLRRRGVKEVDQQVKDMLDLVELSDFAARKPAQLSGGQQQRVALARALINRPGVLLLDEPLGALDLKLRRQMQIELKRIQTDVSTTFVHVTHDQEEAMTMADTIALMNKGVIEQMGPPEDLYENPRTTFVANFLGQSNLVMSEISGRDDDCTTINCHGQKIIAPASRDHSDGKRGWLGVRPEKMSISLPDASQNGNTNALSGGVVSDVSFIGVSTQYLVEMPWGQEVMVFEQNTGAHRRFHSGDRVELSWHPSHSFVLDPEQDASAGVILEDAE